MDATEGILQRIRSCRLFLGLREDEVRSVIDTGELREVPSGRMICRQGENGGSMFIIVEGRVRVSVAESNGQERLLNYLAQGDHFGELSMLVGSPRMADVTAVLDTELLEIGREDFHQLIATTPRFLANLSQSLGRWLSGEVSGKRRRNVPQVVALLHGGGAAAALAPPVVQGAHDVSARLHVFTDRLEVWLGKSDATVSPVPLKSGRIDLVRLIETTAALTGRGDGDAEGQVLWDLPQTAADPRLLMQCELVWWACESADTSASLARLRQLLDAEPKLEQRVQFVPCVRYAQPLPRAVPHWLALRKPDARVAYSVTDQNGFGFRARDVARLTHALQGCRLGLALGGGGARGLAHVGVLEALEEQGVYFDHIAGTSVGSMVAASYAAGYAPREILAAMEDELSPPKWTRFVPKGRRLHMLMLFRLRRAERKFRNYLFDYRFEDLLAPTSTVAVDLVSGQRVVRAQGDVVQAVAESINIPGIAVPILRDGQALVDGGVLDNVPANVLKAAGCDYVVAVHIGSKLAPRFAGSTPETPTEKMRKPGVWETLVRVLDVQQKGLARLGSDDCDLLIAPDTSAFPFDDFTRGEELRQIGFAEAEAAIPRLKQALGDLRQGSPPRKARAA